MSTHSLSVHRYYLAGSSQLLWIEICQRTNVDPRELVQSKLDDLLKISFDATDSNVRRYFRKHWKLAKTGHRFSGPLSLATMPSEPLPLFGRNS